MKVFITRKIPSIAEEKFLKNGFEIDVYEKDKPIPKNALLKRSKNVDAILTLLTENIDKEIIDNFSNCKVIANYAVGYNNINYKYAKKKKIFVTNTPDVLTDSTADLAFTLLLLIARRIKENEKYLLDGKYTSWKPEILLGTELKNKTLGIIGAGRIGQATAKRASAFGMKIIYFNKSKKEQFEKEIDAKKTSINNLLKKSDFISIHLPLNEKTFHFLNEQKLALMKKESIIINTARGEIIDENDLLKILNDGKIKAAGLDVFENEPKINKKLLKNDKVFVLPHIGSATIEARTKMAEIAADNIISVLKYNEVINPVN